MKGKIMDEQEKPILPTLGNVLTDLLNNLSEHEDETVLTLTAEDTQRLFSLFMWLAGEALNSHQQHLGHTVDSRAVTIALKHYRYFRADFVSCDEYIAYLLTLAGKFISNQRGLVEPEF